MWRLAGGKPQNRSGRRVSGALSFQPYSIRFVSSLLIVQLVVVIVMSIKSGGSIIGPPSFSSHLEDENHVNHAEDASSFPSVQQLPASGCKDVGELGFANYLDSIDGLAHLRASFSFPTKAAVGASNDLGLKLDDKAVYLAGNSLGLMPKKTRGLIEQELQVWGESAVLGHMQHRYQRPWVEIDKLVVDTLADVVGAKASEVVAMGSLTGNLHALFTSFYKPTPQRHKILFEAKAFPSDLYAFASQVALHDYPSSSLLPMSPLLTAHNIQTSDILDLIAKEGDSIAIICFGAVQYYSGQYFDIEAITKAGHEKGCLVAFDCAHAVGNVPLKLHEWGVDFACWCSYKYLNSGPGGIAGVFVHERWENRHRLAGWWGHDRESRFDMPSIFSPLPGAAGWQVSNPSVLDIISLYASLENFNEAAQIGTDVSVTRHKLANLRAKSEKLTAYLEHLLHQSPYYISPERLSSTMIDKPRFTIITPYDRAQRGAQLSLLFHPEDSMITCFSKLRHRGILGDERKPGVIRLAPVPLYNNFVDCWLAAQAIQEIMAESQ